jgi:hypothetical protein
MGGTIKSGGAVNIGGVVNPLSQDGRHRQA